MPLKPRSALTLAAAPLCAIALIATGCGGSTSYKDDLSSAETQFKKSLKTSVSKIQASTTKQQYAAGVHEFESAIQTLEGKLRTLKPPGSASAAQTRLVTALDTLSRDLDAVLQAVNSGDITKIKALQTRYLQDLTAVQTAGKELDKKAG
jgi:hypothetical protein